MDKDGRRIDEEDIELIVTDHNRPPLLTNVSGWRLSVFFIFFYFK